MTYRIVGLLGLTAALFVGCSYNPGMRPEPVKVSGVVLLPDGQPARSVTVSFLATSQNQIQGSAQLGSDGKFTSMLTPGKYTFAIEGSPAAMKSIPTKYHSNSTANTIDVPTSGTSDLTIRLTK